MAETKLDAPTQHRVLRQITERIGRILTTEIRAVTGKDVPVHFAYQGEPFPKKPHLTFVHYWLERVTDRMNDRVQEVAADGTEFHRNAPLLLVGRWMLTAWGPPPDDQELLGLAMRVLYDKPVLDGDGEGDEAIAYEERPALDLSGKFSLEEGRAVAEGLGMPLRASARYDIRFRLDSERKTPIKRVKERIIDYKKLDA